MIYDEKNTYNLKKAYEEKDIDKFLYILTTYLNYTREVVSSKKEKTEISEWVLSLAESKFTKFTSKKDIMGIINEKVMETSNPMPGKAKIGHNGVPEFMTYDAIVKSAEPATAPSKPKTSPGTKPGTKPGTNPNPKPKHPYGPDPGENPAPKASMGEEEMAHFK